MENATATKDQAGTALAESAITIAITALTAAMMAMIINNAITMMSIGIIPMVKERTNTRTAAMITAAPGALTIAITEMSIKDGHVMTRAVPTLLATITLMLREN